MRSTPATEIVASPARTTPLFKRRSTSSSSEASSGLSFLMRTRCARREVRRSGTPATDPRTECGSPPTRRSRRAARRRGPLARAARDPKVAGECAREQADAGRDRVDRTKGEGYPRAPALGDLAFHLLRESRPGREPLQILKSRVEGFLFVFGSGHRA